MYTYKFSIHGIDYTFQLAPFELFDSVTLQLIAYDRRGKQLNVSRPLEGWRKPPNILDINYFVLREKKCKFPRKSFFQSDGQLIRYLQRLLPPLEQSSFVDYYQKKSRTIEEVESLLPLTYSHRELYCKTILDDYFAELTLCWDQFVDNVETEYIPKWKSAQMTNAAVILSVSFPTIPFCIPSSAFWNLFVNVEGDKKNNIKWIWISHRLWNDVPLFFVNPKPYGVEESGAWYRILDNTRIHLDGAHTSRQEKQDRHILMDKISHQFPLPVNQWITMDVFRCMVAKKEDLWWWTNSTHYKHFFRLFINGRCCAFFLPKDWLDLSTFLTFLEKESVAKEKPYSFHWDSYLKRIFIWTTQGRLSQENRQLLLPFTYFQNIHSVSPLVTFEDVVSPAKERTTCWPATFLLKLSESEGLSEGELCINRACVDRGWGSRKYCLKFLLANKSISVLGVRNANPPFVPFTAWRTAEVFQIRTTGTQPKSLWASFDTLFSTNEYQMDNSFDLVKRIRIDGCALYVEFATRLQIGDRIQPSGFITSFSVAKFMEDEMLDTGSIFNTRIDGVWSINPATLTIDEWRQLQLENDCMRLEKHGSTFSLNVSNYWTNRLRNIFPLTSPYVNVSATGEEYGETQTLGIVVSNMLHFC